MVFAASYVAGMGMSHWWSYGSKTKAPKYLGFTIFPQAGVTVEAEYARGETLGPN